MTPTKGTFQVGKWPDTDEPVKQVSYDVNSPHTPEMVWIETASSSDSWVAFDFRLADELCEAIKAAASAIAVHRTATAKDDR